MPTIETEFKKLRLEIKTEMADLRKLICGRNIVGNWVAQDMACAMLGIKRRRIAQIRKHLDKDKKQVGCIRWRKSKGNKIEYYKPDLESWLNNINVQ
jgi:hypothetical protein